mgnify:CR=1 FL=1
MRSTYNAISYSVPSLNSMLITNPDTNPNTDIKAETNNERKNNSNNKLKKLAS